MLNHLRFHLSPVSTNQKTGPIPVSTSSKATCSPTCPFLGNGCYAENYPMRFHFEAVSAGLRGVPWREFMAAIAALPVGTLWRHNQGGDFPNTAGRISRRFLRGLVAANRGRKGYTYTHHRLDRGENLMLLRQANRQGLTINASTETEKAADLAILAGLPAVLTVPSSENRTTWATAAGNRVLVCPAQTTDGRQCADCALCHKRPRKLIIAFLAHGTSKAKAEQALALSAG